MRYLALDFETSGIDANRHAPVSLGVALMEDGAVLDSVEWVFAPPTHYKTGKITREYDVNALAVSKYTWPQIKREGKPHAEVLSELWQWALSCGAQDLAIVAYNAAFDLGFYSTTLFLAGEYNRSAGKFMPAAPPLFGPWQCAMMLMKRQVTLSDYTLDSACAHFRMARTGDAHGALEDATLAGRIYNELAKVRELVPAGGH